MTEKEYEAMITDFQLFQDLANTESITQKELFKKIGELDKKYSEIECYNQNINGLIRNIGYLLRSIDLVKFAIKRIEKILSEIEDNKLRYDLANCISVIADLSINNTHSIEELISTSKFNEARREFLKVCDDSFNHYEMALINSTNILDKYGRNFEAIILYDKVLNKNPNFGMALGNKAIAIHNYIELIPQKSSNCKLIFHEIELLEKALADENLINVGDEYAKNIFENHLSELKTWLNENNIANNHITPSCFTEYEIFLMQNNLLLNFDFGYYCDIKSLQDSIFPPFIQYVNEEKCKHNNIMSDKIYFSFQVFSQIIEVYTTARFSYFELLNTDYTKYDKMVNYTYTLDYTRHGIKFGLLKSIFCDLYNCLDKIAHLVAFYYVDDKPLLPKDLYFDSLQKDFFRDIVINKNSLQLLALRNLSLDFQEGYQYYNLKRIRNRITHSFLNVKENIGNNDIFREYEITEELLVNNIMDMFLIVKSALMYFEIAVRTAEPEGLMMPMVATLQKDIFFD